VAEEPAALAAPHANASLELCFSEAAPPGGRRGLVHELLRQDLAAAALADWHAYVAGPPAMVDAVAEVLRGRGLADAGLHVDPFLTAADRARAGGSPERKAS
jgi:naphthalene 1,2-dioxygenase ferredoxin reductase component